MELNMNYATNHTYWCIFLVHNPSDITNNDEFSKWWPYWYMHYTIRSFGDIIYGGCILIWPSTTPRSTKLIWWSTLLPLQGDSTVSLVRPFSFKPINETNRVSQKVIIHNWSLLIYTCATFGILPPITWVMCSSKNLYGRIRSHRKNSKF